GIAATRPIAWEGNEVGYLLAVQNDDGADWNANGMLSRIAGVGIQRILTANSAGTDRFVVQGNGYVGIGTTNPGYPLEIVRSGMPELALRGSQAGEAGWLRFQEWGQNGFWDVVTRNSTVANQVGNMEWYANPDGLSTPDHWHQYISFVAN